MARFAIVDLEFSGEAAVMMAFDDEESADAALPMFWVRGIRAAVRRMPEERGRATGAARARPARARPARPAA